MNKTRIDGNILDNMREIASVVGNGFCTIHEADDCINEMIDRYTFENRECENFPTEAAYGLERILYKKKYKLLSEALKRLDA